MSCNSPRWSLRPPLSSRMGHCFLGPVDGSVASTLMLTSFVLPLYPALSPRAGGCHGMQATLSPFYGLEVRAVTAFIRLDKCSWPCRPFMG